MREWILGHFSCRTIIMFIFISSTYCVDRTGSNKSGWAALYWMHMLAVVGSFTTGAVLEMIGGAETCYELSSLASSGVSWSWCLLANFNSHWTLCFAGCLTACHFYSCLEKWWSLVADSVRTTMVTTWCRRFQSSSAGSGEARSFKRFLWKSSCWGRNLGWKSPLPWLCCPSVLLALSLSSLSLHFFACCLRSGRR